MKKVLILGATGSLGQTLITRLSDDNQYQLTLMARHISAADYPDAQVISGDVLNDAEVSTAMASQDVIFAALSGRLDDMARNIIAHVQPNQKLIFISSMGIYNEIPASIGASGNLAHNPFLQTYRNAADIISASEVNYTIIRPGWFDNGSADYQITMEDEPFGGHDVSRAAIIDLVKRLIDDKDLYRRHSVGINRPE